MSSFPKLRPRCSAVSYSWFFQMAFPSRWLAPTFSNYFFPAKFIPYPFYKRPIMNQTISSKSETSMMLDTNIFLPVFLWTAQSVLLAGRATAAAAGRPAIWAPPRRQAVGWALQLAQALNYLHQCTPRVRPAPRNGQ